MLGTPKVDYSQVQSNIDHDTCFIVHPNSQNSLDSLHTESMGPKSFSVMWRIANATCEEQTEECQRQQGSRGPQGPSTFSLP